MLQNTYQTKILLRCWYLQHRIPFSSFLAFILVVMVSVLANALVRNTCYAAGPTASLELSINELVGQGTNEAAVMANTKVTVNVSSANTYALTLKMDKLELTNGNTTIAPGNAVSDNTWGYKWEEESAYNTPQANGNNLAVPGLTNYAASFSKNLVFAAKFSKDAEAGHYKTSGVLSLVATPATTTYTITYDANGGSNAPASTTCTAQGTVGTSCTTNLTSSQPSPSNATPTTTKAGYTFLGWADSSAAAVQQYNAGSSVTINSDKTLYAIWTLKLTGGFTSITNMQQMTPSICSNAVIGAYKDLTDTRDSNTYSVVKFQDGRCWMTNNLQIVNKTITSADSDVSANFNVPISNLSGTTDGSIYISGNTGYYSWCVATAGTCTSATTSGSNAPASICPKGWKLPTGHTSTGGSEFDKFASSVGIANSSAGSTKARNAPYNFTYTSYVYAGTFYDPTEGRWWSSTMSDIEQPYYARVASNSATFGNSRTISADKLAIRCIARESEPKTYNITYYPNNPRFGGTASTEACTTYDNTCTINKQNPTSACTNHTFLGWSTNQNATSPTYSFGDQITMSSDLTLYGVWNGSGNICAS